MWHEAHHKKNSEGFSQTGKSVAELTNHSTRALSQGCRIFLVHDTKTAK
jgi:hypothetical protein